MIQTVTKAITPAELGRTLMHEHLVIGFPGWESDTLEHGPTRRDIVARGVDRIEEMKSAGFRSMLDPCPSDLGRDVELMAEVATRANFNLVCATGLYHHELGAPYWKVKLELYPDASDRLAEMMIRELTVGIGETGIRAGVIKLATAQAPMTDYERKVFAAGAKASVATGAPITTHTDAVLGPEQVALLTALGVPAHQIIVGHSCGCADHDYHMTIARTGAYIGFDRFGLEMVIPDDSRVESLLRLVRAGAREQLIVSHDASWCFRGQPAAGEVMDMLGNIGPLHFTRNIAPRLRDGGMTEAEIDSILIDNPRRYFTGEPPHIAGQGIAGQGVTGQGISGQARAPAGHHHPAASST